MHDAIATLRRYSLVDATPEFISVHRLVQLVVRDRLEPRDYRSFHEIADRLEHGQSDSSVEVVLEEAEPQSEIADKVDHGLSHSSVEVVLERAQPQSEMADRLEYGLSHIIQASTKEASLSAGEKEPPDRGGSEAGHVSGLALLFLDGAFDDG